MTKIAKVGILPAEFLKTPDIPARYVNEMNSRDIGGMTPFMRACFNAHYDVIKLLLDHPERIELNALDEVGRTAFIWVCCHEEKDVVKLLLQYSKVVDINIPESFSISKKIKNLIKMHSKTVQN